jgi:hypothetical protein
VYFTGTDVNRQKWYNEVCKEKHELFKKAMYDYNIKPKDEKRMNVYIKKRTVNIIVVNVKIIIIKHLPNL